MIAFFLTSNNNIWMSTQGCALFSVNSHGSSLSKKGGLSMYKDNFRRSISLYQVRTLVKSTWVNGNDVYLAHKDSL